MNFKISSSRDIETLLWGITIIVAILTTFVISGCSTTAIQYDEIGMEKQRLVIRGIGEAKFSDGASISGKPVVEVPDLGDLEFEQ